MKYHSNSSYSFHLFTAFLSFEWLHDSGNTISLYESFVEKKTNMNKNKKDSLRLFCIKEARSRE